MGLIFAILNAMWISEDQQTEHLFELLRMGGVYAQHLRARTPTTTVLTMTTYADATAPTHFDAAVIVAGDVIEVNGEAWRVVWPDDEGRSHAGTEARELPQPHAHHPPAPRGSRPGARRARLVAAHGAPSSEGAPPPL